MGCFKFIREKWNKFWSLYREIRQANEKSIECAFLDCFVCWKTCSTIFRANCIVCSNKHQKEEYKYYFKGHKYKIKINKNQKEKNSLVEAFDEYKRDITETIKMYAGPFEDFHGMKITPRMLNFEKIIIRVLDEEVFEMKESMFENDDIIVI